MSQESDFAYYRRRSEEEMEAAERALSHEAKASHLQLAAQYSMLADMIHNEQTRLPAIDKV